ncbi:hypothetical protein JAAARDRAFT_200455 [Jaapia argillacea MUCL 33604]|uniref:Uncharacterized protein n=1 Tax=Jaapia argillacea MUCL 33604 TaxID=933084 RepID=A0A067PFU3_9AGAM|nr:hypothetical protein JAAARDRAFT_200455 [Jaapia argillacea MUCL 33604]
MPSLTYAEALLALSDPHAWNGDPANGPWYWPTFVAITQSSLPPCYKGAVPSAKIPAGVLAALQVFTHRYWQLGQGNPPRIARADQARYFASKGDDDDTGRKAWIEWVREFWPRWSINSTWDRVITAAGGHPSQYYAMNHHFPDVKDHRIDTYLAYIVPALFGEDGLWNPLYPTSSKPPVRNFIVTIAASQLNRQRRSFEGERKTIAASKDRLQFLWKGSFENDMAKPTPKSIHHLVQEVEKFYLLCCRHCYEKDMELADKYLKTLRSMLRELESGLDAESSESCSLLNSSGPLPKALIAALKALSTEAEIMAVKALLFDTITHLEQPSEDFHFTDYYEEGTRWAT